MDPQHRRTDAPPATPSPHVERIGRQNVIDVADSIDTLIIRLDEWLREHDPDAAGGVVPDAVNAVLVRAQDEVGTIRQALGR